VLHQPLSAIIIHPLTNLNHLYIQHVQIKAFNANERYHRSKPQNGICSIFGHVVILTFDLSTPKLNFEPGTLTTNVWWKSINAHHYTEWKQRHADAHTHTHTNTRHEHVTPPAPPNGGRGIKIHRITRARIDKAILRYRSKILTATIS